MTGLCSRLALPHAAEAADTGLLTALAADQLDLGDGPRAIDEAAGGDFDRLSELARRVQGTTGLAMPPALAALGRERWLPGLSPKRAGETQAGAKPSAGTAHDCFASLPADDPFGALAQRLRSRQVVEVDGALLVTRNEARRDEGGYYTPHRLAKKLVARALRDFEEVPAVLDPACGAGAFLAAAFDLLVEKLVARRRRDPSAPVEPVAWAVAALHGVETDPTALFAARLSVAVRAALAERALKGAGQLSLFGQAETYGPLIADRLRLGDALLEPPADSTSGTERLKLRLLARDEPGRLPPGAPDRAVRWDADFPLRFSDEEGAFRPAGGFDLVVTNPPFVPVDRIAPERRKKLLRSLSTAQRRFDLFIGFVERAWTVLAAGGRATLLIPRTFLTESNAERARTMLLERTVIERIEELGPVAFDGARLDCVALSFVQRRPAEAWQVALIRRRRRQPAAVPQGIFRRLPRSMLRLEVAEPAAAECLLMAERSVPLGRYFCASWGARGTPVKDFHLDRPSHPLAKPMLKGDDVTPFVLRESTRWLVYERERLYRPSHPVFFESEKLVVRKVSGRAGLVAAVDESGRYADDSVALVVRKADAASVPLAQRRRHRLRIAPHQIEPSRLYGLHFLAALLHTPLVQTYYRVQLGGGLNVFPALIEALPLPRPEAVRLDEWAELERLGCRAAGGEPFPFERADELARALFGLGPGSGGAGQG